MPEEPPPQRDFAELYRATIAPLRRYLSRLLGNHAEAQEVAHDAYLRVYRRPAKPNEQPPAAALVYTTARNLAINRLKRRSISPIARESVDVEISASGAPGVQHEVMSRQEKDLLQSAIAELPAGCRSVLVLRHVDVLSHKEIAQRLGIAVSTVEKQHARALRLLRSSLPAELMRGRAPASPAAEKETPR